MTFDPGRNVGRVSIRVVPDTTKFREELTRQLDRMSSKAKESIAIDKARLDTVKIRESMRDQLASMKGLEADVKAVVTIDSAKLKKGALRKSIQGQFDAMSDIRVNIQPQIRQIDSERFQKTVRDLAERASRNTVQLGVNAHTLAAAQQLRYTTRPRMVEVFVNVNKASLSAAVGSLAALSGARLSWKWIDDLGQSLKDLDKNLPSLVGWTTGITSLTASLFAATSGLVGIGQGLVTILPAFLTVPGLILNSVASITVLIVALKNSKTELAELGAGMNDLGRIINTTFWERARAPIVNLVQGLMPQLRNAFRDVTAGVGDFTGALANAFSVELADGRLESIFKGTADGWRVLGTGAPAFAGAMTSLSQIAATYTPRLSRWLVRQADTFDKWLNSIANDGRLGAWMEQAIASMYDLWDATTGVAGVFAGIWKAADQAGSTGLAGLADTMQEWKRVVNGADFQRGLAAVFRGSYAAMDAFGGAISSIGRLVADMPAQFERFIGSAGGFIGGLIDAAAVALNNTSVAFGIDKFSAGLDAALAGITPALQPIANTVGSLLGLLGDLAANILPTAAGVIADLMPAAQAIIDAVGPVLPPLVDAVTAISNTLAPAVADLVKTLSPSLQDAFTALADGMVTLAPHLATLVESVGPLLADAINDLVPAIQPLADILGPLVDAVGTLVTVSDGLSDWGVLPFDPPGAVANYSKLFSDLFSGIGAYEAGDKAGTAFVEGLTNRIRNNDFNPNDDFDPKVDQFERNGIGAGGGFSRGLAQGISAGMASVNGVARGLGASGMSQFGAGAQGAQTGAISPFQSLQGLISGSFVGAYSWLQGAGSSIMGGLLAGMRSAYENVKSFVSGIATWIVNNKGPISYDKKILIPAGMSIMQGLNTGLQRGFVDVQGSIRSIASTIADEFGPTGGGDAPRTGRNGAGNNISVTMPLLPGETPKEQRDNLVEELKWAV